MDTFVLNLHSFFQLLFSIIFFVIILSALYPKDTGKRNISWLLCASSFFLHFILQFLNSVAPSSYFSAKVMVAVGFNVSALSFLYPYSLTLTLFGTTKNRRIYLAAIFLICCLVAILHYFNLVLINPVTRPPLGYYATPGPYFWVLLCMVAIGLLYCFSIILRSFALPGVGVNQKAKGLWIFVGTLLLFIATLIQALIVYDVKIPRVSIFVWVLFAVAIGYSVFRQKVFGFGGIATSTVSSLIVGTLFVMAHHTIIKLTEKLVVVYLSLPESEYISIITALVLIIFVQPLYVIIHRKIEKLFHL